MATTGKSRKSIKTAGKKAPGASKTSAAQKSTKAAKSAARPAKAKKAAAPRKKSTAAKRRKPAFAAVKAALQKRREQLVANLSRLTGEGAEISPKPVGDRIDDAAFDLERHSLYAIAEQEAQEIRLIDTALEKIENGTYGICEECGKRIERARLKALPYAVLCLKCKEAEEMEQAVGDSY